jgi:hypothetical protein
MVVEREGERERKTEEEEEEEGDFFRRRENRSWSNGRETQVLNSTTENACVVS